ncbi:MAG: helix-turn-helix domain-containing protein, partial [Deltaproteobacteria bacterium]|nr:helix-turn-helix domain-containing protein [Deltaproteobacteria bacterium]
MDAELLTTRDAAELLGVGTTSIKRWADSGLLECVKTPGGHRRFPRDAVVALLDENQEPATAASSDWLELLTRGRRPAEVYDR